MTIYLKVISLSALGMSIQQAAGLEMPRKNPPRGPSKKKTVTSPVEATEPAVAPTTLATRESDKAA